MDNIVNNKLQELYKEINKILPSVIDYGEFKLLIDETSRYIYRSEEFYSISKSKIFKSINDFIFPKLILDIGANNGFNSILFSKQFPEANIVAIEPNPALIKYIKSNIDLNSSFNVKVIESIVGTNENSKKFQINNILSVDSRVSGLEENFENIIVQETTIDRLISNHKLNNNDNIFIKIDTQGYEKQVLDGFHHELLECDFLIEMEFAPYWLKSSGTNPYDFFIELCEKFTVIELPKSDLYKDDSIQQMKKKRLDISDAIAFVKYVEESGKNKRGWCDLLLLKK